MFRLAPLPRNVEAALRDVSHEKEQVRLSALRDMGRHAGGHERKRVIDKLVQVLANDASAEVRARAAVALADVNARGSDDKLLDALKDPDTHVRQMALLALGELGSASPATLEAVRAALSATAPALRFQALVALHHLGASDIEQHISEKLSDDDEEVRFVALRIAEERLVGDARRCPDWLSDKLATFRADDSDCVRLLAAIVLHRAERETDSDALVNAVNHGAGTREPEDEQAAIDIVGDLGLERAVPGLERRAFGWLGFTRDAFAWQARVALAKMGHKRAISAILADLNGWTWEARTLAAAAAGAARLVPARARLLAMLGDESRANQETVQNALHQIDGTSPV